MWTMATRLRLYNKHIFILQCHIVQDSLFLGGEMYKANLKYSNHTNHLGEKKKIPFP